MRPSTLVAAFSLAIPAIASPFEAAYLEARDGGCNHDNLYRLFLTPKYTSSASAYCNAVYPQTATSVVSAVSTDSFTVSVSTTSTDIATTLTTTTTTTSQTNNPHTLTQYQRDAAPTSPPGGAGTYPASKLASACSCVYGVTVSATTTATTDATVTTTQTSATTTTGTATDTLTTTSTTSTQPPDATATLTYCNRNTVVADDSRVFNVDCGNSYTGVSGGTTITAANVGECLDVCDSIQACNAFTFTTATTNNCYLLDQATPGQPAHVVNTVAKSGYWNGNYGKK